jgi:hypothetical protein
MLQVFESSGRKEGSSGRKEGSSGRNEGSSAESVSVLQVFESSGRKEGSSAESVFESSGRKEGSSGRKEGSSGRKEGSSGRKEGSSAESVLSMFAFFCECPSSGVCVCVVSRMDRATTRQDIRVAPLKKNHARVTASVVMPCLDAFNAAPPAILLLRPARRCKATPRATGHSPMQKRKKSMNLHPPILLWPGWEHSDQTERGRARGQQQHASKRIHDSSEPMPDHNPHNTHTHTSFHFGSVSLEISSAIKGGRV